MSFSRKFLESLPGIDPAALPPKRKAGEPRNRPEEEFTAQVLKLASLMGWRTAHFRPAMTQSGRWVTAVQGDGKGFPDLILIRGHRLIVAELKCPPNKATAEQTAWLLAFGGCGSEVFLWTPANWTEIEEVLK